MKQKRIAASGSKHKTIARSPLLDLEIMESPKIVGVNPIAFQRRDTYELVITTIAILSGSREREDYLKLARLMLDIPREQINASLTFDDEHDAYFALQKLLMKSMDKLRVRQNGEPAYHAQLFEILLPAIGNSAKDVFICNLLIELIRELPEKEGLLVATAKKLIDSRDADVRKGAAKILFKVGTEEAIKTLWSALASEVTTNVALEMLTDLSFYASEHADWERKFSRFLIKALNYGASKNAAFATFFVRSIVPLIKDMEKFVTRLRPEVREGIKSSSSHLLDYYPLDAVAFLYFNAACNGQMIRFRFKGISFKFFLAPAKILKSAGRTNLNAIAIAEETSFVPEQFRAIVAYHEFVESQEVAKRNPKAHEAAIAAEMRLTRDLDRIIAYRRWLESIGENGRF